MTPQNGRFITFEGIEGCGKTTQNQRLADYFRTQGHTVIQTREPGGTAIGQYLRTLILDPATTFTHPYTEVLLFFADRLEHVQSVIAPALEAGHTVLCDRYIDSTVAYQKGGRHMPSSLLAPLTSMVPILPDLTILLDISVQEGLRRAKKRADLDRFEQEDLEFHARVRQAYLDQAASYPDRITIVSVDGLTQDEVFSKVLTLATASLS